MCKLCGRYYCKPSCPSFMGKYIKSGRFCGVCASCDEPIYSEDKYFYGSELLCDFCSSNTQKGVIRNGYAYNGNAKKAN